LRGRSAPICEIREFREFRVAVLRGCAACDNFVETAGRGKEAEADDNSDWLVLQLCTE